MGRFLQKAAKSFKEKGTEGTFSAAARRHGMSTEAYADKVLADKSEPGYLRKRANFARNAIKASRGK